MDQFNQWFRSLPVLGRFLVAGSGLMLACCGLVYVPSVLSTPQSGDGVRGLSVAVLALSCLSVVLMGGIGFAVLEGFRRQARVNEMQRQWEAAQFEIKQLQDTYNGRIGEAIGELRVSTDSRALSEWMARVAGLTYRNEVEVEIKLVYPMLKCLGYSDEDLAVRYQVPFQLGREQMSKEADWVVSRGGQPFLIIEAKAPQQALDEAVQAQGRSYAYGLNAALYLLINGRELALYERGVQTDKVLVAGQIAQMALWWNDLHSRIGNTVTQ